MRFQTRKYFDSGDFALSAAHKPSDIGAIITGAGHPLRCDVPHPACPVPSSSNVEKGANWELGGGTPTPTEGTKETHLHEGTSLEDRK